MLDAINQDLLVQREREGLAHLQVVEWSLLPVQACEEGAERWDLMEVALAASRVVTSVWHDHIVVLASAVVRVGLVLIVDHRTLDLLKLDMLVPRIFPGGVWDKRHLRAIAIGRHLERAGATALIQVIDPLAPRPLRILDEGLLKCE